MPRAPDGTYTLPNADVAPGDTISSAWANSTMNDIASAMTESLSRAGNGTMTASLQAFDGVVGAPGIAWADEVSSGFYRESAGVMAVSILNNDVFRWRKDGTSGVAELWNGNAWVTVLAEGVGGTVPDGTADGQVAIWDQTGGGLYVSAFLASANVTFDPTGNNYLLGDDVQEALDQADAQFTSFQTHISDTAIHFDDAPVDGTTYNRRDGLWVESVAGISDHSALNGLTVGDDHTQYHNNARGDARYYQLASTVDDSTLWDNYAIEVTATPGSDPNTVYFVPV